MIPASILTSVVLPAPLAPTRPTISPSPIRKLTSLTAVFSIFSRLNSERTEPSRPASFLWTKKDLVSLSTSIMEKSQRSDFYSLTILHIGNVSTHWRTGTRDNDVINQMGSGFRPAQCSAGGALPSRMHEKTTAYHGAHSVAAQSEKLARGMRIRERQRTRP